MVRTVEYYFEWEIFMIGSIEKEEMIKYQSLNEESDLEK